MMTCKTGVSCRLTFALLGLALVACVSGVRAQTGRDPTIPPAGVASVPVQAASASSPALDGGAPVAVIVRDGQPFLVVGTRLYAQGQMLGNARIERIDETAVWLREGRMLRRKPVFSGIERHVTGAAATPPKCAPPARQGASTRSPPFEICQP